MSARTVYSVVQYVPDPFRGEGANVGVLVFVPGTRTLRLEASPSLATVKKFFNPTKADLERVASAVDALKHRLRLAEVGGEFADEDELARFAAARADAVQLTPPRPTAGGDPAAVARRLYAKLVGDPELKAPSARAGRSLPSRLAEVFGRLEGAGKVWRPDPITVPTFRRPFKVDAAYENGAVNFVRSESLAVRDWEDKLEKLGFNGKLIAEHGIDGDKAKLVVVSAVPKAGKAEARSRDVLSEFGVRFVSFAEADAFAAEVEREAH
jgi:hypothetical protein